MKSQLNILNNFVKFAATKLALSKLPKIHFVGSSENVKRAFGHSMGNEIWVRVTDRHPIDVMRTICHELIHFKQIQTGKTGERFKEDEANALAGRIMREYDITYPRAFRLGSFKSNVAEETISETESLVPANSMGASSSTQGTGGIDTFDPLLRTPVLKRKKLKDIIGPKTLLKNIKKAK